MASLKLKNESFKNWFSNYSLKDWKFWFKLSFVVLLTVVLLIGYLQPLIQYSKWTNQINNFIAENGIKTINELIDKAKDQNFGWIKVSKGIHSITSMINFTLVGESEVLHATYQPFEDFITRSSFFTLQSNILVLVWMYVALLKPQNEGKKGILSNSFSILTATYITVTFLIYQFALRPTLIMTNTDSSKTIWQLIFPSFLSVLENETFHTFGPLAFVLYVIFGMSHDELNKFDFKALKKNWMYGIIGLVSYGVYAISRGLIKEAGGADPESMYTYPYFFLQVTTKEVMGLPGIVWFILFVFIIAGIYIGFSTLYRLCTIKATNRKTK